MLPRVSGRSLLYVTNGSNSSIVRHLSWIDRNRKHYELTVDEDDQEYKNRPNPLADIEHRINQSKQKLVWRQPPEPPFQIAQSILSIFATERQRAAYLQRIVKPFDFTLSWQEFKKNREIRRQAFEQLMQDFVPERHQILGNNLAAAHFLVHRGAEVRFTKSPEWVKMNEDDEYELPSRFDPDWLIDGIKCDGMELYFEGLGNIRRLYKLKTFSLKNVKQFDDWCLDRLAGSQFDNLEVLDLSGTNITANGLVAVPKIPSLKVLILSDIKRSITFELSLLMLQDLMPNLEIREAVNSNEDAQQTPTPSQ